jgi:site-specific DNA-methyltransferase (adenine-specific)/adenine-specific DNA-methyltransferase
MRLKLNFLTVASTATLRQIAEDFELSVADRRKRQALIDAISLARSCQPEDLLGYLGEPEVRHACKTMGVDSRGRKNVLITRLLEAASPAPAPAPTSLRHPTGHPETFNHSRKRTTMTDQQPKQVSLQLASNEAGTTNVEKYEFQPIKGYPMLNWKGKRPFTSTHYYPAQLKEVYGEEVEGWRNKIFWGDNLQVMSHLLKGYRGKVDLVYIDPPFDSKADYKKSIAVKGKAAESNRTVFEEKQYTDIWTNDEYLQFMYERLLLIRELLSEKGALYLHCNVGKGHYLKCILDEIFGADNFRNEIVWCFKTSLRSSPRAYGRDHELIFFYARSGQHTIHPDKSDFPPSESTIKRWAPYADENGFVSNKHFAGSDSTIIDTSDESKGFNINHGIPRDWWEISSNVAKGNTDEVKFGKYPTQKPETLIERIVKASSDPGDLVFDCFMGSGTTQAVSMRLGRRFLGADVNLGAVQLATKRLLNIAASPAEENLSTDEGDGQVKYPGVEVFNVNHYEIFRNPVQAKDLLLEALEVQKLEMSSIFDGEKDGRMVKFMPVNRIATREDLNELIAGFDYKAWERRQADSPNRPVEKITLVCMGHEPDLAAHLKLANPLYKIDVEVVDILRDKADLEFKRESEAKVVVKKGELVIERFFPMNLLQKLSLQKDAVDDWRELVESILIDWNFDGAVLQPAVVDIPGKDELVKGAYKVPDDAGTIRVKITDLLSESWEGSVSHG